MRFQTSCGKCLNELFNRGLIIITVGLNLGHGTSVRVRDLPESEVGFEYISSRARYQPAEGEFVHSQG